MEKLPISVVILTKNEAKNIERVLQSVKFADNVVVIDDNSEDNTIEKAREFGALVYKRSLDGNFAAQRNYGIEKAKYEWILFVDADEEVSNELQTEIKTVIQAMPRYKAFCIKRRDFWWGTELKYGETQKVRNYGLIRLIHKNSGTWKGYVHETFVTKTNPGALQSFINHYPHQTIKEFIYHVNIYSTLRAQELFRQKKKTNTLEIIGMPLSKFILNYFIYLGFMDGPAGFAYSFMMSFHSFLVRAKLYQYWNYPKK